MGQILSCGEGTADCSLATRELYACAQRMHRANGNSPGKPVRPGHPDPWLSFVSFVSFVVKVFLNPFRDAGKSILECGAGSSGRGLH